MLLDETSAFLPQAPYRFRPTPQANFPGQVQATASVPQAFPLSPVSTSVISFSAETQFSEDRDYAQRQSNALLSFFPLSVSYIKGQISQDEEKVNKKQYNNYSKEG